MAEALEAAVCGAVGACAASACTYPLDVVKTRLQAQSKRAAATAPSRVNVPVVVSSDQCNTSGQVDDEAPYTGALNCMQRVAQEEGLGGLYAGLGSSLAKAASTNFIYYYSLRALSPMVGGRALKRTPFAVLVAPLLQAIAAGICVQLLILPLDMIVARLQTAKTGLGQPGGAMGVLKAIIAREGVFGLWSGLRPGLFLTLNPGITNLVQTVLHSDKIALRAFPSAARNFVIGLISKAVASIVTYPYMVAKVQMQVAGMQSTCVGKLDGALSNCADQVSGVQASGDGRLTMTRVIAQIVEVRGLPGLFQGLAPQLTNAVLKEAILNMVRLEIASLVARVFQLTRARSPR